MDETESAATEPFIFRSNTVPGDFYSPEVTLGENGILTLCVGGTCKVRSVQQWHELDESKQELSAWQQFAGYCRSCALSGEHDPQSFEDFVKSMGWILPAR